MVVINRRPTRIFREPRRVWWGGGFRTLVAISALAGLAIAGTYYEPDGYVAVAQPVCGGVTAEGCSLRWQDVPTEDGGVVAQCVQFCPRRVAAPVEPPPITVMPEAPPVMAVPAAPEPGTAVTSLGCALEIHSEPGLTGISAQITEDQPDLAEYGWDKAISSMEIRSGTWDFYSEDNFGGQVIRLPPGRYDVLAEGWDKQIVSMMCVQP